MASSLWNAGIQPLTDAGKWLRSDETSWPRKIESSSFVKPRKSIDAPRRAPNRCCAASPPAPWQHGIAPKRQPTQFISPTDVATDVCDGTDRAGNRSCASVHTETTELSVVSGSCGSAAATSAWVASAAVRPSSAQKTGMDGV